MKHHQPFQDSLLCKIIIVLLAALWGCGMITYFLLCHILEVLQKLNH